MVATGTIVPGEAHLRTKIEKIVGVGFRTNRDTWVLRSATSICDSITKGTSP